MADTKSTVTRRVVGGLAGAIVVLFLLVVIGLAWPFELAFYLAAGWMLFLRRVSQEITVDWATICLSLACLITFTVGLHAFLVWLAAPAERESKPPDVSGRANSCWRWRWTISGVAGVVMLFVAGTSMVGIAHQLLWWAMSPEPTFSRGGREAAYRMQSSNNLRQLGLATHVYAEKEGQLPPGGTMSPTGKLKHGWQAFLLPYQERQDLYDQIHFNLPWNHDQNSPVYQTELDVLQVIHPHRDRKTADEHGYPFTDYAANVNVMGGTRQLELRDIADGAANTILAGEAVSDRKPWAYPANWRNPADGINQHSNGFGSPWNGGTQFVMTDGSVRFLTDDVSPDVLRALATPAGGEQIGDNSW